MKKLVILFLVAVFFVGITGNSVLAKGQSKDTKKTVVAKADTTETTKKTAKSTAIGKININKAGAEQLAQLKGVGPALADRIVDYRKKNGNFKNVEQIMEVKGIGEKTFGEIKKHLSI